MDTQCPYCSQTITIPTTVTLKKPNVAKRSTRQLIGFLKSNPKISIFISVLILLAGGICWYWYAQLEEEYACYVRLMKLEDKIAIGGYIELPDPYNWQAKCPSGKPYIIHLKEETPIYKLTPRAVIVECPKHKDCVMIREKENSLYTTAIYQKKDFDRSLPLINDLPVRKKALAFLDTYQQEVFHKNCDMSLDVRVIAYWGQFSKLDKDVKDEIVHILKLTEMHRSEWKWIPHNEMQKLK